MQRPLSIFASSIFAVVWLLSSVGNLLGQEQNTDELRKQAYRQWFDVAQGRAEFDIADPTLVPTQLAAAATQSGCRWRDVIAQVPVHVFKIDRRRFAKVTCFGFGYQQQIYDLSQLTNPRALQFPVVSWPAGFATTSSLGAITWNPESKLLESVGTSDLCGQPNIRHTYRWINSDFSIIRIELSRDNCGSEEPWQTIWEAPQWSSLTPNWNDR
ncbi:hypothetical protein S58_33250 [Bradyrhizobium oligotrophicum S58]|uniref:DUF1176 domain-containing protein n=1 Tax=Bradyrhizobium oligotrophicum S58 TaxID=1245469 RepID=M4Z7L8_9BRAD|nr:hypothetical protein [Bradyrhizobium oligotrophicum]BAM89322.1 hypothetical protein S58_33250 [Bradyrhizobium oligotrophicum S58]